jgi:hypothetical protein
MYYNKISFKSANWYQIWKKIVSFI